MASLKEQLNASDDKRKAVVEDACRVLDAEVADKGGISGMAIKGAYKVVKGVKPGFIREVVDGLLDAFADALQPLIDEALDNGQAPASYLAEHRSRMADDLLAITDRRADKTNYKSVAALYRKLRGSAKKHVEAAAPRLGEMVERHLPA